MWKFSDLPWHEWRIYPPFTSFSVLPILPLFQLLECHVWQQVDNETSNWFPYLHRIEQACKVLPLIYHCSTKSTGFRLQTSLIWKKRKNNYVIIEVVARRCSAKSFPKNFSKFTEKYLYGSLFLTLLIVFRPWDLQHY